MRLTTFFSAAALIGCLSFLTTASQPSTPAFLRNETAQEKPAEVKVSKEEASAALKINQAVGAAAKLQVAADFLKKFPKSSLLDRIASALATEVANVSDPAQRLAVVDTYLSLFKEPGQAELVSGTQLDAYLSLERADDAFRQGSLWLEKNPDDVDVMRRLSVLSSNEAVRGNSKYVEQGNKYGVSAIQLLEADKMPSYIEVSKWGDYKARWLPHLYREAGVLALRSGDKTGARTKLARAAELKSIDPVVYAILGQMTEEEYEGMATKYKAMPAGAEKQAMLQTVQEQMDKIIGYYAQATALTGEKPEYGPLRAQLKPALEEYYKFRHNGSLDGLPKEIDKYKGTAAPAGSTSTPTTTATPTPGATASPTPAATATPASAATATPTPTPAATATPTPAATASPTPRSTSTPAPTSTPTPKPSP